MAKRTDSENLAFYKEQIAKIEAKMAAEAIRDNIEPGDVVTFQHGRAETAKQYDGTVMGVKDGENGRWVKVQVGEGFDAEVFTIRTAAVSANPAADARNGVTPEAPAAEPTPMDVPAVKPKAPKDPLEAE